MALEKFAKIPSLVRKVGQSASKAQPFYSNVDQAIANITQGTGTGAQMLAELMKTKGVAKELKDRPAIKKALEAAKDTKVTKADVERLAADNPPPQIQEKSPSLPFDENNPSLPSNNSLVLGPNPHYPHGRPDLPIGVFERETGELITAGQTERDAILDAFSEMPEFWNEVAETTSAFRKYTIPGGENYREVLIKLPENRKKETWEWFDPDTQESKRGFATQQEAYDSRPNISSVVSRVEAADSPQNYRSSHFDEPNILAHARVIDRVGPNGEKILHVEEVQSDWHQAGRKKGYRGEEAKKAEDEFNSYSRDLALKYELNPEQNLAMYATKKRMQPEEVAKYEQLQSAWVNSKVGVIDAPFKQNWHELVMKRLLDDAARNGYDKVVITPGAKQAERYDLSKQISRVVYSPTTETLNAFDNSGKSVLMRSGITPERVEDYIGKEPAKRLLDPQNTKSYLRGGKEDSYHEITGEDLRVGGEGMKGFYDQIVPSFLNDYGKKYGARVGTYNLPDPEVHHIPTLADIERGGMEMFGRADLTPEETLQVENAFKAQRSAETAIPLHSFDITPQMREEITTKGQPLYQVAPPVAIGAGAAMQEEEPTEYAGGGIIKKAGQIIGKAAQSSGMAPPVTATKNLTTMQDFHTSLGDRIRENALEAQKQMESFDYKYDKGQRVFTQDSAAKNKPPYTILGRTRVGNRPMTEDGTIMGKKIIDPETGKTKRTPYEPGYRVRYENGDDWSEFDIPATAIMGDVEMAGGGAVRKALKAVLPKGQQAVLPAAESAANLERFLAESAIKDRLYHSTKHDFSVFDTAKEASMGEGSFFGYRPNMKLAQGEGGNVMPVHLSIKNPKVFESILDYDGFNKKELMSQGHDGVIVKDNGKIVNAVAFQPTQIKSAIGNRGTYDPAEADITKAKGGQVSKDAMWIALQNKQLRKKHGN